MFFQTKYLHSTSAGWSEKTEAKGKKKSERKKERKKEGRRELVSKRGR